MLGSRPMNRSYVELIGAAAVISKTAPVGMANGRTVEFFADFMPTKFSTTQANNAILGTYVGGPWFEYDAPTTNSTSVAPIRFGSVRNLVDKYSGDGEIQLGVRTTVYGKDDGVNVYAWQDGVALGVATSQAAWTAAQAARAIDTSATLYFGFDNTSALYTALRLYELWIKVNGTIILHYVPSEVDDAATTVRDESGLGNTGALAGTLNTDYRWGSAWNRAPILEGVAP